MEVWKDIPGYEGWYQVSDQGRVRSLDRTIECKGDQRRFYRGTVLALQPHAQGYKTVCLRRNTATASLKVHVIVCAAFIGPRPTGFDVRHLNGDPGDNRLVNLAYGTRSENNIDGVYNGRRKLTPEDVRRIRELCRKNKRGLLGTVAKRYGVSRSLIALVAKGKVYRHVV